MVGRIEGFENGVEVHQTTDELTDKSNIYCEYPWCPPDSHCFVYMRVIPENAPNPQEFVACEFGTWEKRVVGRGNGGATMANGGRFYYGRIGDDGRRQFVRVDLESGASDVIELPPGVPERSRLDIAIGERYVAYNQALSYRPQRFAIGLADLQTGECGVIHEDPYICNTHHQFEPGEGKLLLVQHNRGCRFSADGRCEMLVGEEGATLFLLEAPSGRKTPLQVGPPHTHGISGHEAWIGTTGEIIATLNVQADYDHGKGGIVGLRPGEPAREICAPWRMNHIGIEPSGRIFCADTYEPDEIILGSPRTNRSAVVCPARASYKRARDRGDGFHQDSHPHAYVSPDRRWVVFNSDRTGVQQVYAARIPSEMIEELDPE